MPLLEVEIVDHPDLSLPADAAQRVADAVGELLGAPPGRTWVRLRRIPREDYAENGGPLEPEIAPVFVRLLEADPPEGAVRAARSPELARALGGALRRPASCVHVLLEPAARGRIAFGGRPVE